MSEEPMGWASKNMEITFVVTKDCQLACKYCYLIGKNSDERMSWQEAKAAVDYILSSESKDFCASESVVFNFIGGEPFLEIELIERICEYIENQMMVLGHHWLKDYSFSFTTNGINYDNPRVQNFIKKHKEHVYIAITIDGTQRKHDLNRVWKHLYSDETEKGSYVNVVKNIPLWLEQFPKAATKVTVSSEDIPFVCESVLHIFSLGIQDVHINCVFEDVWKEGDDLLLEQQLCALADEMVSAGLYKTYNCSFFDREIGYPLSANNDSNWCGVGRMLAIDGNGNYYPCLRFAKYSLRDKPPRMIGNIHTGIIDNLVRPFQELRRSIQSPEKCLDCNVASGCAWCQGENYDCSASGTIFYRSTAICKMHKARVKANNYFWKKVDDAERNVTRERLYAGKTEFGLDKTTTKPDNVIVMLASDSTRFCLSGYRDLDIETSSRDRQILPLKDLEKVINTARQTQWHLQFMHPKYELPNEYYELIDSVPHYDIVPYEASRKGDAVVINSWNKTVLSSAAGKFHILLTTLKGFYKNVESLDLLLCHTERVNIVFSDEFLFSQYDYEQYQQSLEIISDLVIKHWKNGHRVHVNTLTDRLHLDCMSNCDAGWKSVTLAPNGCFYICPAFYDENPDNTCGSLEKGIDIKDSLLYKLDHSPLCSTCNAYHCQRCVFLNKQKTIEVNVPSFDQCKKAEIELDVSKKFFELLYE